MCVTMSSLSSDMKMDVETKVETFPVNKDFAEAFTKYRKKEEYEKLKSKFSSRLTKYTDTKNDEIDSADNDSEADNDPKTGRDDQASSSPSSSSDEESSIDEEFVNKEREEFLVLIDALERRDPALNDKNRKWFSTLPSRKKTKKSKDSLKSETNGHKPVNLKDFERETLLETGRLEDEETIARNEQVRKLESDELLDHLKKEETSSNGKAAFLEAVSQAEKMTTTQQRDEAESDGNETDTASHDKFQYIDEKERKKRLKKIDPKKLKLTVHGKPEDEEFLLNYLLHHNDKKVAQPIVAKRPSPVISEKKVDQKTSKKIKLSNVCDWLIRKDVVSDDNKDEQEDVSSKQPDDQQVSIKHAVKLSAENSQTDGEESESDGKLPRSYPRNITDTYRQTDGNKSRAQKRKDREQRKRQEKDEKMRDLKMLKTLKLQEFQEKIDKIKKVSGLKDTELDGSNNGDVEKKLLKIIDEDADWDPELHDKMLAKIFDDKFYQNAEGSLGHQEEVDSDNFDVEKPVFSDDDEADDDLAVVPDNLDQLDTEELKNLEDDNEDYPEVELKKEDESSYEQLTAKTKRRRRKKKLSTFQLAVKKNRDKYDPEKYPDFDEYFDKFYKLACEDVINGQKPGEDIYCRFKYRKVKPNDFGLSTDEILNADDKELNKWISVKRMSQYRQDEDEDYDFSKFHANPEKIQYKKKKVFKSLFTTDEANEDEQGDVLTIKDEYEVNNKKNKKAIEDKPCPIDEERLLAAGLDKKQIKSAKWKLSHQDQKRKDK